MMNSYLHAMIFIPMHSLLETHWFIPTDLMTFVIQLVKNGQVDSYVCFMLPYTRKFRQDKQLANLANRELFAKIFLTNSYRYTKNAFGICFDHILFTNFFFANSFYGVPVWFVKIFFAKIFLYAWQLYILYFYVCVHLQYIRNCLAIKLSGYIPVCSKALK